MKSLPIFFLIIICATGLSQSTKMLREVRGKVYDAATDKAWKPLNAKIIHKSGNVSTAVVMNPKSPGVATDKKIVITNTPPMFKPVGNNRINIRAMLVGTIDGNYELWDCGTVPTGTSLPKSP